MSEVWLVVFSNYEPAEMIAIYDNEEAAQKHVDALGGDWTAQRWQVQSAYQAVEG